MREIKFRGKRIDNGEWVYGSLFRGISPHDRQPYSIILTDEKYDAEGHLPKDIALGFHSDEVFVVEANSVGQFTELLDINEKDLYEGDIVEWNFTYEYICASGGVEFRETIVKGIIKWQQGGFILDVIENDFEDAEWYSISALNTDTGSDVEIIGNIHDNPELIKQNKEE